LIGLVAPIPPALFLAGEAAVVDRKSLLPLVAVSVLPLDPIGLAARGGHIRHKATSLAIPGWLLALPDQRAGRPGQLIAIVENTDGSLDLVDKAATRGLDFLTDP